MGVPTRKKAKGELRGKFWGTEEGRPARWVCKTSETIVGELQGDQVQRD